jgi:small subunit ribosomal protein S3Ae
MAIQKKGEKWKMKKWFSVYAPKVFNELMIGEMPANDDEAVMGRNIVVGLDVLTRNPSHAYTNVVLKVTEVNGNAAHTKLISISQLHSYIRSLVRRYRSVASLVLPVTTRDGTQMVVKALVITRSRVTHSRVVGIRKEMAVLAASFCKENDTNDVINAILEGKFQSTLASQLKHIAPLNKIEIKKLDIK